MAEGITEASGIAGSGRTMESINNEAEMMKAMNKLAHSNIVLATSHLSNDETFGSELMRDTLGRWSRMLKSNKDLWMNSTTTKQTGQIMREIRLYPKDSLTDEQMSQVISDVYRGISRLGELFPDLKTKIEQEQKDAGLISPAEGL